MSSPVGGLIVTAFPVPGENFRARDGKVRGVTACNCHGGDITVHYIDGHEEIYEHTNVQEVKTTDARRWYPPR